jgi:hypothetical protein
MTSESRREEPRGTLEVPAPTPWPMIAALGVVLGCAGLVTNVAVSVVGILLLLAAAVGWFREVLPREHCESVAVERPALAVAPARVAVAHLKVGELGHRAQLPLKIYPYSAGIKGGIAGGVAMAVLAVVHGVLAHGSPWYTINILAATAMAKLATADVATLCTFNATAFIIATVMHALVSLLVGLLYGILLPMFPRHPAFFGGFAAPLLWTGLLWVSLNVINPVLDARIEWRWFILCQIAFGLVAGFVVARSERIDTIQHMPFLVRAGIESPGLGERKD